jgi:hypothetical protein
MGLGQPGLLPPAAPSAWLLAGRSDAMTDHQTQQQPPGELLQAVLMRAAANRAAQINRRHTANLVREIKQSQREN